MNHSHPVKHINPALLVVLIIVTCGFYAVYLLYRWIFAINDSCLVEKKIINPWLAIILTLLSFGIAGIYFQYEIVRNALNLANEETPGSFARSPLINPPKKNLKEIVLYGNIISFAAAIASSGHLSFIPLIFDIWLILEIQSAMEYSFGYE